jgi:hypothetical protein
MHEEDIFDIRESRLKFGVKEPRLLLHLHVHVGCEGTHFVCAC